MSMYGSRCGSKSNEYDLHAVGRAQQIHVAATETFPKFHCEDVILHRNLKVIMQEMWQCPTVSPMAGSDGEGT